MSQNPYGTAIESRKTASGQRLLIGIAIGVLVVGAISYVIVKSVASSSQITGVLVHCEDGTGGFVADTTLTNSGDSDAGASPTFTVNGIPLDDGFGPVTVPAHSTISQTFSSTRYVPDDDQPNPQCTMKL